MSTKHKKNGMLTRTIWKLINFNEIFKLIMSIDEAFFISKTKLIDSAVDSSNMTALLIYWNAFNWFMSSFDRVAASKSISSSLDSDSLYLELVVILKLYNFDLIIVSAMMSWLMKKCLKTSLASLLIMMIDLIW